MLTRSLSGRHHCYFSFIGEGNEVWRDLVTYKVVEILRDTDRIGLPDTEGRSKPVWKRSRWVVALSEPLI